MRFIRTSTLGMLAAAAATLTVGAALEPPPSPTPKRTPSPKYPRGYAAELNRKQSRQANRSEKQHLLKGVRP